MNTSVQKIHGGLSFKAQHFSAIKQLPLPESVTISIPDNSTVTIAAGERVLTGQPMAEACENTVMSHASLSGVVTAIDARSVTIKSDHKDEKFIYQKTPVENYQFLFQSMGLVGLGGAAFPVFEKLQKTQAGLSVDTLLINAAECDPAIYCDEALMQERAADVVKGIQIAQRATGAKNCIVGIEENKTEAIAQLRQHLPNNIQLICVPAIYPSGAEQTLFKLCTGYGGSLQNHGAICFNIATCYSMYCAAELSQPLISRIVTVVSHNQIANYELRLGTPIQHVLKLAGFAAGDRFIEGGKMMGQAIAGDQFINKHTNSLILHPEKTLEALPCIRCGACADVCPENLYPQQLHWHSHPHNTAALNELKIDRCIECACCDAVCPSHIPLASSFNNAMSIIQAEKAEQNKATLAKLRYEKRLSRLNDQSSRQRKELDKKTANLADTNKTGAAKKALIAKALTRRKNKKPSGPENNPRDASR